MAKKAIGQNTYLYPMPTAVIGTEVDGKVNFLTVAYIGIINHMPAMLQISLGKVHFSNLGIKKNGTFSVNLVSSKQAKEADFVGIKTGGDYDKSQIFDVFYGETPYAPMIKNAPLTIECSVEKVIDFDTHETIIGRINQTHIEDDCMTNGKPDLSKIDPLIFSMHENAYYKVGEKIGNAWEMGLELDKK